MSSMPGAERLAPAHEGPLDADLPEPVFLAGERVRVEHGHVGELAELQGALAVLLERDQWPGPGDQP